MEQLCHRHSFHRSHSSRWGIVFVFVGFVVMCRIVPSNHKMAKKWKLDNEAQLKSPHSFHASIFACDIFCRESSRKRGAGRPRMDCAIGPPATHLVRGTNCSLADRRALLGQVWYHCAFKLIFSHLPKPKLGHISPNFTQPLARGPQLADH